MEKPNNKIEVIVINPPTKKQAEDKIKELSKYLSEIWKTRTNPR